MSSYKVVFSDAHGDRWDKRYVVVDTETGKILDDAQGYGYKSVKKAYAAYAYKTRDKSKDVEKKAKREKIRAWMKSHKGFVRAMDEYAFEIAKGSWGPDDKFDTKFSKHLVTSCQLEGSFCSPKYL